MCMCMGPVGQIVLLLPTSLKTTCQNRLTEPSGCCEQEKGVIVTPCTAIVNGLLYIGLAKAPLN